MVIERKHELFAALRWVASARSDDETRYGMTGLCVEELSAGLNINHWRIVATDGRRLHYVDIRMDIRAILPGLEPGVYAIEAETASKIVLAPMEAQFPGYAKVCPALGRKTTMDYGIVDCAKFDLKDNIGALSRAAILLYKDTGRILNIGYAVALSDARWTICGPETDMHHTKAGELALQFMEPESADNPLAIRRSAVIMPMQE